MTTLFILTLVITAILFVYVVVRVASKLIAGNTSTSEDDDAGGS